MLRCASCSRPRGRSLLLALDGSSSLLGGAGVHSLGELSHGSRSSLAEEHHFEALEVVEVGAGLSADDFLSLGMSSPLLIQVISLSLLNDRSGSFSTLQIQSEPCQLESLQGVNHSFEVWSVNEHAVFVGDVGDHNLLAVVLSVVDKRDTAALNEIVISWLKHTS